MVEISQDLFSFKCKNIDLVDKDLSEFKGSNAYIVVNVASKWGLTDSHYKAYTEMYTKYR